MPKIKELAEIPERLTGGHRLCSGCGASIVARHVLMGTKDPVVVGVSTGCLEVATTIYPYTAWNVPFIHNAFENVAATISGAETAYRVLRKKGKVPKDKNIKFIAFGGDGGTFDIGLQSLSGALEREHDFLYVCYTNEAYMNCLSTDSLIMTKDGLKKITEVEVGDEVYAFDQKSHQLVLKQCSGVFDNGIKDVYELQTLHHSIKATSNHPFLVVACETINGVGNIACQTKTKTFVWKTLEQIKAGDEVVTLDNLEQDFEYEQITSIKLVGREPTLDLRVEGEHNFIADGIVVHNTGIQRSGATPKGASTTTAPAGKQSYGKPQRRKDLTEIVAAHGIPYVAQANIVPWNNLISCAEKAFKKNGPTFINAFSLCQRGWRYKQEEGVKIAKLAADTCYWPLYEVDEGEYHLLYKPKKKLPVTEFFKTQGRFKHLFKPGNEKILEEIQQEIDENWERLLKRCE